MRKMDIDEILNKNKKIEEKINVYKTIILNLEKSLKHLRKEIMPPCSWCGIIYNTGEYDCYVCKSNMFKDFKKNDEI
jgi:hypothetical protein